MRLRHSIFPVAVAVVVIVLLGCPRKEDSEPRKITRAELEDKIRGGWVGQMIGVSYGAPTEFQFLGKTIEQEIPWHPEEVANAIRQDDLYVDMVFAGVMDKLGLEATTEQYGEAFKDTQFNLWHANAGARRALNRGIKAPMSGHPKYNIHANDIDFQIESDFIGLMCPGLPQEANKYCDRVGHVMNYGDGVYGGNFVCGMYSAAYFEKDPRKIIEKGLACMPQESGYARVIRDVLDLAKEFTVDTEENWKKTWAEINKRWDKDDPCSDGALRPWNIDARLNGAYIAIGMLYGKGDFSRTIEITTRCGQDSDCNPSSACGILGVVMGYKAIPDSWKSGIERVADKKFNFTDYSLNEICKSTLQRAFKIIKGAGGTITDSDISIPVQLPTPPALEQWDMGVPEKILVPENSAWNFEGNWVRLVDKDQHTVGVGANGAGAQATLTFTGSGVSLIGNCGAEGGRADVFIDGEKSYDLDMFVTERTHDNDAWHIYDLKPGEHKLRLVMRDDADSRAKGKKLVLQGAISFQPKPK